MADVLLQGAILAEYAATLASVPADVTWDLTVPGSGTFGCVEVADAVSGVGALQHARADVLVEETRRVAGFPARVAERFAATDQGLARSIL